jgi:MYXO-CTERM domain-containing protein
VISLIFGQELGHAWGSFVYYSQDGGPSATNLLGRSNAHWSFYLDSGGSPMQGHEWVDNGDGTFTAHKTDVYAYSDLDLYLMGLLPAQDVAPWFVLEDPYDCFDAASGDGVCAPPTGFQFEADTYTVGATRRDVAIEDVIAVEGPRVPAWPEAPTEFDVSFLLIKRPGEVLDDGELAAIDGIVLRSIELFELQTRGLGRVINRTASEDPGGSDSGGVDESGGGETAGSSAGSDAGATTGDGGDGDTSGGATGEGTTSDDAGQSDGEGGCACAAGAGRGTAWAGVLLLGVAGLRRRRAQGYAVTASITPTHPSPEASAGTACVSTTPAFTSASASASGPGRSSVAT